MDFPTLILTLLSGNWLFFNDDEIAWDGEHHRIVGIQVNAIQIGQFMDFVESNVDGFDDIQDVVNYFIGFLQEAEKDTGLIVPRESIAPGLHSAMREGDLTGITLANLAACGAAFSVQLQDDDVYTVLFDTRLANGIPAFFSLIARLIWDLRQLLHSKQGVPLRITFLGTRNTDADQCLGEVTEPVAGAQNNPIVLTVESCPIIDLTGNSNTATANQDEAEENQKPEESEVPEDSEDLERENILTMLQLLVLSGQLNGTTFPQPLLDRLEQAQAGDKSIDLLALAEELNNVTPEIKTADLTNLSFSEGHRAEGRKFSIAIPNGWSVLKDMEEGTALLSTPLIRPFVVVPYQAQENDDVSLSDRILYNGMVDDAEPDSPAFDYGITPLKWALTFYNCYDKSDKLAAAKPTFIWDEEVIAKNTHCLIAMTDPTGGVNGINFYIYPLAVDNSDFLRCTFDYEDDTDLETLKDFIRTIAQSVELADPVTTTCEKTLDQALQETISCEAFTEMVLGFTRAFVAPRQMVFNAAQMKYVSLVDEPNEEDALLAGAKTLAEFANRATPTFSQLIDAYEKQREFGADSITLDTDLKALEIFNEDVFPTPALFREDPANAELLEKAGVLDPSLELQEVRVRFVGLAVEAPEAPTPTIGKEEVIEDTTSETAVIEESFRLDALPKIAEALTAKVSADEFVDLCESVGFDLMRKRQEACDAVVSPRNTDEENIIAMAAEVATFNPIIVRYIGYLLDALEAQITLGATLDEVTTMLSEVEELTTLIADRFSCGNEYLDAIANEKVPIEPQEKSDYLHKRLDSLKENI